MLKEIYNDDSIFCGYQSNNNCKTLLITFAPLNGAGEGQKIWGGGLKSENINILGLVAKNRSWYPTSSVEQIADKCAHIISQYEYIICYGTSAGAYAAIKFGSKFRANAVVAFAPIFSIAESEIDIEIDHRFYRFFKSGITGGNKIIKDEITCPVYLVYDHYYRWDKYNANLISSLSDKVFCFNSPFTGHFPILTMNSSAKVSSLVDICSKHDIVSLKVMLHQGRVNSSIRVKALIEYICLNKPKLVDVAHRILLKHSDRLNNNDKASVFAFIGRVYKQQNRDADAAECFENANFYKPNDPLFLRELSSVQLKLKDFELSEKNIFHSLAINTSCCHAWNTYTSILLEKKDYNMALGAIKRAIQILPHRDFYRRLCTIAQMLGLNRELVDAAEQGIKLFGEVEFYRLGITGYKQLSDVSRASELLNQSLAIYPNDSLLNKFKNSWN
ncbi:MULTISPECIES: tetratricopeptide repeat protein [Aeromonas]|uniref:tetratricopeptide repeat protein n=1 Tax=Aeromonas TaxID=642 RepID=UPI000B303E31|nr:MULTISPECIES: tetratricopeptide repeat protein [Aeromonas]